VGNADTYRVLLTARRVGPALGAAGITLVVLGVLACTRGSWPLALLGAVSVVVGGLVFLIGIGARARSNLLAGYENEAELDARIMATVRSCGADNGDEAGVRCDSCDLGCAPRTHP
jgi:hypothetical protein